MAKIISSKITVFLVVIILLFTSIIAIDLNAATKKPAQVKKLTATAISYDAIKIRWKKAKRAKKYKIYISTGGKYKYKGKTKTTVYTAKKLIGNKEYYFKVRAIRDKKKGKISKSVYAKTHCKVIFVYKHKENGSIKTVKKIISVKQGNDADEPSIPKTIKNDKYKYTFNYWDKSLYGIKNNITINAVYKKTSINSNTDNDNNPGNGTNPSGGDDPGIISGTPADPGPVTSGWSPDKGFSMFERDYNSDICAAYGFGCDANVVASIKYYKNVDKNSSDIDKIRGVAEWLADNLTYGSTSKPRRAICGGYSNLYKHLLNTYFGVPTIGVVSYIREGNHGWNLVKYNNKWYAVDVTLFDAPGNTGKNYDFDVFMKSSIHLYERSNIKYSCDWGDATDHNEYTVYTIASSTDMDKYNWRKTLGYGAIDHNIDFTCANCGNGEGKYEEFPDPYKCPHCGTMNYKDYRYPKYPTLYFWTTR